MDKKEYEWKKSILELEHKNKMEQLSFIRKTEELKHEWDKERGRIKSAEIRKTQLRKMEGGYKY